MNKDILLSVRNLTLCRGDGAKLVDGISFDVRPGEIFGIVGESGSGKTLATRALMALLPAGITPTTGETVFEGQDTLAMSPRDLRSLRGARIGMVFQEPMTSLNPSMVIGRQLEEGLKLHTGLSPSKRREAILAMLERVGIVEPERALSAYPHEFSGGMRQRIMLASVMLLKPALLVADEPTTALDAVIQRDVMELMVELTRAEGTAVLLISHDLPMVARYTSRIAVMEKGVVVESGTTEDILTRPQHPYTRKLLSSLPGRGETRAFQSEDVPVLAVEDVIVDYLKAGALFRQSQAKRALHGVSVTIRQGEVVALVGGSGSGKTTLGRTIAGLIHQTSGEIRFGGRPREEDWATYRRSCQMVFQDPYSSLDPRMTILKLVEEALRTMPGLSSAERRRRALATLAEVGLPEEFANRLPHELSGGQRQRVAIARAVVRQPKLLIADEPVSALDVTVRAQVLALFADLQKKHGFSCLFISHDLSVVEQIADRVIVMQHGEIVEEGPRDGIFDNPQHAYTRRLLSAIPALDFNETGGVKLKWRLED
ncbi:ABC transporter ATP-binding protein [Martelella radicis]|uniref:Peptide/nickel transport system ATP-binding protein n=1 Tax=Martelella radicis TaxID=1397476 RepID=A0A7W6P982_9HYPH|nr:ABC transporter ATP-binding protein [Martelella radicis]MBB4122002.1 peptide/nickel transport system ATP-binding protein [Martelella radicis]